MDFFVIECAHADGTLVARVELFMRVQMSEKLNPLSFASSSAVTLSVIASDKQQLNNQSAGNVDSEDRKIGRRRVSTE